MNYSVDPEGLITKGQNVLRICADYEAAYGNIKNLTDRIESSWQGSDASAFITQVRSYDNDFKQLGETIARIGEILGTHGAKTAEARDASAYWASRL